MRRNLGIRGEWFSIKTELKNAHYEAMHMCCHRVLLSSAVPFLKIVLHFVSFSELQNPPSGELPCLFGRPYIDRLVQLIMKSQKQTTRNHLLGTIIGYLQQIKRGNR